MARTKQVSKRKRRRIGLPALGAAGVSLVTVGREQQMHRQRMYHRCKTPHCVRPSLLMRRKLPTSAWGRFTSSTRKTNPGSAKA